jgi:hypothetical protein
MALFGEKPKVPGPKMSGPELMLRNMGFGPVLDMAIKLAQDGTLDRILQFADDVPKIMQSLERIEATLARYDRDGKIKPYSSSELVNTWPGNTRARGGSLEPYNPDSGPRTPSLACGEVDRDGSGTKDANLGT